MLKSILRTQLEVTWRVLKKVSMTGHAGRMAPKVGLGDFLSNFLLQFCHFYA